MFRRLVPFLIYPTIVFGGAALFLTGHVRGYPLGVVTVCLLLLALCGALILERRLPFHHEWLRPRGDVSADVLHGIVGLVLSGGAMALYGWASPWMAISPSLWPRDWPFLLQALLAGVVVDFCIYVMHRLSHSVTWLWRLHAVHHGAERLYTLNGERRHPLHFLVEGTPGLVIAGLLGAPAEAMACFLTVFHIHLLFQHGNIAYRAGWLRFVFAVAENHRWHHRKAYEESRVNYGGFFAVWDHLFGTALHQPGAVAAEGVGIDDAPNFPKTYLSQLAYPFEA